MIQAALVFLPALLPCSPAVQELDDREVAAAELVYRIERVQGATGPVVVHLELRGDASGTTELAVAERWGGVEAGGEDLADLTALGETGAQLAVERPAPHRWIVRHGPGEQLTVRYSLAPNGHQLEQDPDTNRRPIVNEHVFHGYGELFLATPAHLAGDARRTLSLAWDGFGEKAYYACSFGVGPGPHVFEASLDQLVQAVYLAGDVRLVAREIGADTVWLAADDRDWAFDMDEFADLLAAIVETERAFFGDQGPPFYLVTLIPVGVAEPGSLSLGGTGLVNSFSLAIQPGLSLDPAGTGYLRVVKLLAHEMFHEWNGRVLGRDQPEELVYWFSEGFTDFFTRRLLLRCGAIGVDDYVGELNEMLRRLHASPVRGEPNTRIRADFWNDADVRDLPYVRGDFVALLLDHAIRQSSGGERSLDDLFRALVARARAEGWKVSTAKLLEEFATWTTPEVAEQLRAIVEDGALPSVSLETLAPCLALRTAEVASFDAGFDLERSIRERVVHGVRQGGPAAAAGLRDGLELSSWSVYQKQSDVPIRLTVKIEGAEKTIEYMPAGERLPVPRFERAAGADEADCAVL